MHCLMHQIGRQQSFTRLKITADGSLLLARKRLLELYKFQHTE